MNEAQLIAAINEAELGDPPAPVWVNPNEEIRNCAKAIVQTRDPHKIQDFRLTTAERGKVIEILWDLGEESLSQEAFGLS